MTTATGSWSIRLTAAAEADFRDVVRWTLEQFGDKQALTYAETLSMTIESLTGGPDISGARYRDEIAKGLYTLHVAQFGRKGRHLLLFRVNRDPAKSTIDVLRVLHDAMDLLRHVPAPGDSVSRKL